MAKYAIGLDIGGTKIHSVVAEWDKYFLRTRKLPKIVQSRRIVLQNVNVESKFFGEVTGEILRLIAELGTSNVARVGVGIAGPLSRDKVSLSSTNLPLKNFPTLKKLEEKFGSEVYVDNDANCFTWAEYLFGAARSAGSSVGITLGTGVGGGIVLDINGKSLLWEGYSGSSAEVGHMILDGGHSFEDLCSSKAQYLWKGRDPLSIEQKARAGDKESVDVYQEYGFWLGIGVANTINVVDPEIVVIGGSLSKAWDLFENEMHMVAKKYIISTLAKKTKIVRAKLGDDAGALGAAYLL